jgi:hypothetical protein
LKNNYFIHGDEVWIELNRPKERRSLFAVIDLADLPLTSKISGKLTPDWHHDINSFYAFYTVKGKKYYLHRLLFAFPDNKQIDHVFHDGLDNRRSQLRIVTNRENHQNLDKTNCQSIYPGVRLDRGYWRADIRIDGRRKCLGTYKVEIEAARAYRDACIKYNLPILQEALDV